MLTVLVWPYLDKVFHLKNDKIVIPSFGWHRMGKVPFRNTMIGNENTPFSKTFGGKMFLFQIIDVEIFGVE